MDAAIAELRWVERPHDAIPRATPTSAAPTGLPVARASRSGRETALVIEAPCAGRPSAKAISIPPRRGVGAVGRAEPARAATRGRGAAAGRPRRSGARSISTRAGAGSRGSLWRPDLHLDLGGIAKGYGIDRSVRRFVHSAFAHAIVTWAVTSTRWASPPKAARGASGSRSPDNLGSVARPSR